jgi:invasion protein IalB
MISRVIISFVAASLCGSEVSAEEAMSSALTYSPWAKACGDQACFVMTESRSECGSVAGAMLIEPKGEAKKLLRVSVSRRVSREPGLRIIIDQDPPISRPYLNCFPIGCIADYEAGSELVERLKRGRTITLEAVDTGNAPINLALPLVGFADAYDGPPQNPKRFEASPGRLQVGKQCDAER